jgi:hypothetical protein
MVKSMKRIEVAKDDTKNAAKKAAHTAEDQLDHTQDVLERSSQQLKDGIRDINNKE